MHGTELQSDNEWCVRKTSDGGGPQLWHHK